MQDSFFGSIFWGIPIFDKVTNKKVVADNGTRLNDKSGVNNM